MLTLDVLLNYTTLAPGLSPARAAPNSLHLEFYYLCLLVVEAFVLFGNLFLIVLISTNKTLYTNNNTTKIVLSLSITDLMLSILVMPFTFYAQLNNSVWRLGQNVCIMWLSSDIHLTTTSIFHLCALSYERYLSVAQPIKFRKKLEQRARNMITCGWLLSFTLVTLPFCVLSFVNTNYFYKEKECECGFFLNAFIVYTTLITFWLPLVFMIFHGVKTMMMIKKIDRLHRKNASSTKLLDITKRLIAINEKKKLLATNASTNTSAHNVGTVAVVAKVAKVAKPPVETKIR